MAVPKLTYKVEEAARAMGVGRNTMYELVKRKDFPAVKVGKKYVIPIKPFEAYLEQQAKQI